MIKLYHSQFSRSLRVRWLMEEMGTPYELSRIDFMKGEHRTDDFAKLHPLNRLPVMEDGPTRMIESGAMVEYLLEKNPSAGLRPAPGIPEAAEYLQWFHFGEATYQVYLSGFMQHYIRRSEEDRVQEFVDVAVNGALECAAVLDDVFKSREFVAGDSFSAADIMVTYPMVLSHLFKILPADNLPNLDAYYARIRTRSAYAKASAD